MAYEFDGTDDFEEEESTSDFSFSATPGGSLCVVDCSDDMIVKDPDTGVSRVVLALEAIKSTYCNKLISGSRDLLGVILCGTATKTNDYPGLHVLLPLDTPDKTCVDVLNRTIHEYKSGQSQLGHGHDYSPYHLLWTCSSIYTSCVKKLSARVVMIFTNVVEPPNLDAKTRSLATTKARDMSELDITISIITMPTVTGAEFDMNRFYGALVPDHELTNPTNDLEELSQRVHRRETKVRMLKNLKLSISPELSIGVQCCNLYGPSTAKHVNLCSKTNQPVVCVSSVVKESDRSVLLPHEIHRSCKLGSETVIFTAEEIAQMKVQADKGFRIIGFRPNDIKFHHVAGSSLFLRPDETTFNGSTEFFMALLDRLAARDMVALCHCVPREGSTGYIGALIPQQEERDENREQVRAAGFNLVRLPWAEDVRKLTYEPGQPPSTAQVEAAKALVMKLKARYTSDLIDDPHSQQFNKTLEAIALEKDQIEETEDLSKPDLASIDKRAGKEIRGFNETVLSSGFTIPDVCKKPDYKRVISLVQTKNLEGTLNKVSVADLRLYCKGVRIKISSTAKKAELLEAVKRFLG